MIKGKTIYKTLTFNNGTEKEIAKMKKISMAVPAAVLMAAGLAQAETIQGINIDFVNVGNAGNAADTSGHGAVGYNYRISQKEIAIWQFEASGVGDGDENHWNVPNRTVGTNAPAVNISFHEAARFCNWLTTGNPNKGAYSMFGGYVTGVDRATAVLDYGTVYVVPTEDEWYKAAYYTGSGYSLYANGTDTAPAAGLTGANYNNVMGSPNDMWAVGSGLLEANHGTYDMMGNVDEWTETMVAGTTNFIIRGGREDVLLSQADRLSSTYSINEFVSYEYRKTGLRIAAIPEPGTISLMGLSTVSLFVGRRARRKRQLGSSVLSMKHKSLCDSYCSEAEWFKRQEYTAESAEADAVSELKAAVSGQASRIWTALRERKEEADKRFWNFMVARHERKQAKRIAARQAFRKRLIDGFDAFLALIMK